MVEKYLQNKFFLLAETISEPFKKEEFQLIHKAFSVAAQKILATSIQAILLYLAESRNRANQVHDAHIAKYVKLYH